ncbi:hypothetical protein [Sphingomonas sp. SUN039]|uniref:hypothetical protein n=1 Tax=Sphingomonas sp. SUN039 TaxID=2937787 RepID=UPI002164A842|nr:hypothetical protein [Sphingomonas sp. SUN039]UVO53181.1 hypothetical protein M0209_03235 [Sphingomonas sp. SUN039]
MTLAALIILEDDGPTSSVLGLSWPEFQLRRAVRAGALHLVLVADRVGRDVVEAIDRLRGEGLPVTLARSTAEVADLFHPQEAVLLLTGSSIVADERMKALLAEPKPALLCIGADRAGTGHELIDAHSHWVGMARLDGAQIRATASMAGDWDLGSMLLRKAVAARAGRIALAPGEMLGDASDPAGATAASRSLVAGAGPLVRGWGARWIIAPLARLAVRQFPAILPSLARLGPWVAMAAVVLAAVIQLRQWTSAALIVFLAALLVATAAQLAATATGIAGRGERLFRPVRDIGGTVLLAHIAVLGLPDLTPGVLALCTVAFIALADRLIDLERVNDPRWIADAPGHAVILSGASIFGPAGVVGGLAFCALHGLASLSFLQNRLSRVLTSAQ